MNNDKIVSLLKENKGLNNLYFIMARSQFLKRNEQKGVLNVVVEEPEKYLQYISKEISELPQMQICYDCDDEAEEYNSNNQFVLSLETKESDGWHSSLNVIDIKTPRRIFYSEIISLSGSNFDQEEHILNSPCAICERISKVKLEEPPYHSQKCECCDTQVFIKFIFECTKCCTQYAYKSTSL